MRVIMTRTDRQLGMGSPITRRDFLNGVALGIGGTLAAGWLSPDLETLLAQGQAGAYPPALTGLRGSHAGSFEAFHSMRDGAFWKSAAAAAGHRGGVRPRGGRRRHQRPGGRARLPQGAARRARPGPRQPRRLRRPRQAQRVHARRPHLHRLRRHAVDRQPRALQPGGQGPHLRAGHRGRALFEGARLEPLQVARPAPGVLLRQGNLRHRSPAGRRPARRCVSGRGAGERRGAARSQAAAHRALRPDAGPQPVREEGAPRAHELCGLPHQVVEARPRRAAALPDAPARVVRRRHRRGAGAGCLRLRLSRVRRDGPGCDARPGPELRLDSHQGSGGLLLPFPRRQRVGRAAPRAPARAGRPRGFDDGRRRDGAGRLRQARRRRSAGENPVEQFRDARAAQRARGPRPARRGRLPAERHAGSSRPSRRARSILACWHSTIPYLCPELPAAQKTALEYAIKVPLVYTNVFIRRGRRFRSWASSASRLPGCGTPRWAWTSR